MVNEPEPREPVDPDLDAAAVNRSRELQTVALVAAGGIVGAVARYEAGLIWPTGVGAFPWTTLGINLLGSLALAVLVVLATDAWPQRSWLRPLIGTGVIGGFTTFSTFSVDIKRLLTNGHVPTAVAYVALTLVGCSALTWVGAHARPSRCRPMNLLCVVLGAAVGAPLRYLTDRTIQSRHGGLLPLGTLTVNLIASLVLGLIVGAASAGGASHQVQLLIGTGFCATLSTYSTFSFETLRLAELGHRLLALANVTVSVVAGVGAAFAGAGIADLIWT